jgi:hypothetical protein
VPFWKKDSKPSPETRIATALERLVALYTLELQAKGLTTYLGQEAGEVILTDEDAIAAKELEDELRRRYGLPETHDFSVPAPALPGGGKAGTWEAAEVSTPAGGENPEALFGASWGLGFGPEGAESFEPRAEEAGTFQLGPPGSPFGSYYQEKQKGESGPDSGEEPERGAKQLRGSAGEKAGE